jgi:N-acetyl-gamma-glutamyl-phosphate reductase
LSVYGSAARGLILVGRLDNLGKGAAGNAVQCMNLMFGFDESQGLLPATSVAA